MDLLTGKRVFSIMALCMMVGLLLLPIVIALPSPAIGEEAPAGDAAKKDGDKVEKGRDVYYKTEGIVVGAPAPKTTDGPQGLSAIQLRKSCLNLVCQPAASLLRELRVGCADFLYDH